MARIISTSPPLFLDGDQKVWNFAPIFDPTRIMIAVILKVSKKSKKNGV